MSGYGDSLVHALDKNELIKSPMLVFELESFIGFNDLGVIEIRDFFESQRVDIPVSTPTEPIVQEFENGIMIFAMNPVALKFILDNQELVKPELCDDLALFSEFVDKYGSRDIYLISTF